MPKASSFGVFALSAVLAVALSSAVAADSPAMIPLQGFLTDAKGAPITGSHRLTFTLYDASTNGNALYLDDLLSVDVDDGYFVAYLGNQEKSPLSLSLFRDHPDLWVEVVIDGTEIVQPRTYLASVPHAAM